MTVTEFNKLVRQTSGPLNLVVPDLIVPDGESQEIRLPAGVYGRVQFKSEGCDVVVGGFVKGSPRTEKFVHVPDRQMHDGAFIKSAPRIGDTPSAELGEHHPVVSNLTVEAQVQNGAVFVTKAVDCKFDVVVIGSELSPTGVTLESCSGCVLDASVRNVGYQDPSKTGQGYSVLVKSCVSTYITGFATNARYGVVFTGGGCDNLVSDWDAGGCTYAVEFHGGIETRTRLNDIAGTVRLGNDAFLGTPQGLVINGMSVQTAGTSSGSLFVGNP